MRIRLQVSGGIAYFPGLAAPSVVDADTLPAEERQGLERLVEASGFFARPQRTPTGRGAADCQTYRLTIEDGRRRHSVEVSDPVADPPMQQLIEQVRRLAAGARRHVEPHE